MTTIRRLLFGGPPVPTKLKSKPTPDCNCPIVHKPYISNIPDIPIPTEPAEGYEHQYNKRNMHIQDDSLFFGGEPVPMKLKSKHTPKPDCKCPIVHKQYIPPDISIPTEPAEGYEHQYCKRTMHIQGDSLHIVLTSYHGYNAETECALEDIANKFKKSSYYQDRKIYVENSPPDYSDNENNLSHTKKFQIRFRYRTDITRSDIAEIQKILGLPNSYCKDLVKKIENTSRRSSSSPDQVTYRNSSPAPAIQCPLAQSTRYSMFSKEKPKQVQNPGHARQSPRNSIGN